MRKYTPIEMSVRRSEKIARAGVRLKYSLLADEELNEKVPEMLEELRAAINEGQLKKLNIGLSDILGGINP